MPRSDPERRRSPGAWLAAVVAVVAVLALTAVAVDLVTDLDPGPPVRLDLDAGGELFLRGAWEIWLAWGLAVAAVLLATRVRRRPRIAALALVPLLALGAWLGPPLVGGGQPDAEEYTSAEQLFGEERKTVLVGVDALNWNRLQTLIGEGRLPHFQRLMAEGSYGVLRSLYTVRPSNGRGGYWSPVVWTTIATGRGANAHGVEDFMLVVDGEEQMANSLHRRVPAFWNVFSAFHRPVGVVGWWATHPAEEVTGVMVSSSMGLRGHRGLDTALDDAAWFRGRRHLTHPEWYRHVVADDVGLPQGTAEWFRDEIFPYDEVPVLDEEGLDTLISVAWQDRLYLDTTLHLLATEELSLYATYFEGTDVLAHRFWQYLEAPENLERQAAEQGFEVPAGFTAHRRVVDRYYEVVDGYVGRLVEAAGDGATVMVVADHGFRYDEERNRGADHSPYGAILMKGPGIRAGHDLNLSLPTSLAERAGHEVGVLDVLPTLLYLHGLPISDELEGEVLAAALTRSFRSGHPRLTVPTYGDFATSRTIEVESDDVDEYRERMRSLGYIR